MDSSYGSLDKLTEPPMVGNQRKWNVIKTVLRVICAIIEISVIGIDSWLRKHDPRLALGLMTMITLPVCLAWAFADFITSCVRRSVNRGIKPGGHVGVELLIWIALMIVTGFGTWMTVEHTEYYYSYYPSYWDYNPDNVPLPWTEVGLVAIDMLLHFTLFVRACVEVNRRRRDLRIQQVILAMQRLHPNSSSSPNPSHTLNNPPNNLARSSSSTYHRQPPPPLPPPAEEALGQDFVQKYNMLMAHWPTEQENNGGAHFFSSQESQKVLLDPAMMEARAARK